jgi:hypothetical protein
VNDHPIVVRCVDVLNQAHDVKLNNDFRLGKGEMIFRHGSLRRGETKAA